VLVLGSEAHGLSPAVHARLDAAVRIPGASPADGDAARGTESLNVAVAAGILVYEWLG
jgi:TrmH family RNA methyltransferase